MIGIAEGVGMVGVAPVRRGEIPVMEVIFLYLSDS
jgi:hypothetical protein